MLQIKNITKTYITGELKQTALNGISFNLRKNELVAILGQSGSGKTTTLNIIGGLDRYDSGDIIINNISTEKYTDRDWDSYRNHTIGFVFQSYNLIPHQTILSNVELALTISGVNSAERKRRATKALEDVGLKDHIHKRPNQMSGGQMQRVAIARALVNDPDILLADEPTGALDSETSLVVMDLLEEIAKDRLVVLVTHNEDLATEYATRIIKLHDGEIISDSNPYLVEKDLEVIEHQNLGKTTMSFFTALALSFNNLKTKKARTFLTSFAGSIGIIGIALILALSNGVNAYIENIQKETMASYPITLEAQTMDLSSIIESSGTMIPDDTIDKNRDGVYANSSTLEMITQATTSIKENNLTEFKKYLDNPDSEIHQYVGSNGIIYGYDVSFRAYAYDEDGVLINTDGSTFEDDSPQFGPPSGSGVPSFMTSSNFVEILHGQNDSLISDVVLDNYELIHGQWPSKKEDVVLILERNQEISMATLYELGLLPSEAYHDILDKLDKKESIEFEDTVLSYEAILEHQFYLIPESLFYQENDHGTFNLIDEEQEPFNQLFEEALELNITGIIQPTDPDTVLIMNGSIGYTRALTDHIIDKTQTAPVVTSQENNPDMNILNGLSFSPEDDAAIIEDTIDFISSMGITDKSNLFMGMIRSIYGDNEQMIGQLMQLSEIEQAAMLDQYLLNPDDEVILSIYDNTISPGTYDDNMTAFGVVSLDAPTSINIYTDSFEDKDGITDSILTYNQTVDSEFQITYTDYVGLLMSSVTTIINVISYVLIAFVAVSLVVSSIMIGIITYISVLERTKEIGILRAIGASKRNISNVFNAETFIVGFLSGVLGIGITLLLLIPGNAIIHNLTNTTDVSASLPINASIVLILLSLILTVLAGLIPASKAAKQDPVIALRSE